MPDYIPQVQPPYGMANQLGQMAMEKSQIIPNALSSGLGNATKMIHSAVMQRMEENKQQALNTQLMDFFSKFYGPQEKLTGQTSQPPQQFTTQPGQVMSRPADSLSVLLPMLMMRRGDAGGAPMTPDEWGSFGK